MDLKKRKTKIKERGGEKMKEKGRGERRGGERNGKGFVIATESTKIVKKKDSSS